MLKVCDWLLETLERELFLTMFIKLLEAIGAILISEEAMAEKIHFQENVTLHTDRQCTIVVAKKLYPSHRTAV